MVASNIIAFRAEEGFRNAVEKAATFHGTNRSLLLKSWIVDRLVAEGFAVIEDITDEQDQAGDDRMDESDAELAGVG